MAASRPCPRGAGWVRIILRSVSAVAAASKPKPREAPGRSLAASIKHAGSLRLQRSRLAPCTCSPPQVKAVAGRRRLTCGFHLGRDCSMQSSTVKCRRGTMTCRRCISVCTMAMRQQQQSIAEYSSRTCVAQSAVDGGAIATATALGRVRDASSRLTKRASMSDRTWS